MSGSRTGYAQQLPKSLSWLEPHTHKPAVAGALPRLLGLSPEEQLRRDPARRRRVFRHPVEVEAEATRLQRIAEQPAYRAMIADPQHVEMVRRRQEAEAAFRRASMERGWNVLLPDDLEDDERELRERALRNYTLTIDHLATEEAHLRRKHGVEPVIWRRAATWQGPEPRHDVRTLPQIEYYLANAIYFPRRAVDRQSPMILGRLNAAVRNAEIALDELGETDHRTSSRPLGDMPTYEIALDAALWLLAWIRRRMKAERVDAAGEHGGGTGARPPRPGVYYGDDPTTSPAPRGDSVSPHYDEVSRTLTCCGREWTFKSGSSNVQTVLRALQAAAWAPTSVRQPIGKTREARKYLLKLFERAGLAAEISVERVSDSSAWVACRVSPAAG